MKKIQFSLIIKVAFIVLIAFLLVLGNEIRLGIHRYIQNTIDSDAEVTIRNLDQFSKTFYENYSSTDVDLNSEKFKKIYRHNVNSDSSKVKCLVDKNGHILETSREGLKFPYICLIVDEYQDYRSRPVYFDVSSLDEKSIQRLEEALAQISNQNNQATITFSQTGTPKKSKKVEELLSNITIQKLEMNNEVIYENHQDNNQTQELSGTVSSYASETLKVVLTSNSNEETHATNYQVSIFQYRDAMTSIHNQIQNHFQEFINSSTSTISTNYGQYTLLSPYEYHGKYYSTVMLCLEDNGGLSTDTQANKNQIKGYLFVVQEYDNLTLSSLKQFMIDNISTYVLSLLLIVFICFFVAYMIVRPVYKIETAAKHIAKKDFHYPLDTHRHDELGDLSRSISTMSHELEKTINDLNQEMNKTIQLENIRKEFVSNFTHEIKTPLGIINGFSELIELENDEKKRNEYIGIIQNETQKINSLVKAMLDLSKLESKTIELHKKHIRLDELVKELVDSMNYLFEKKNIECILYEEEAHIYADAFQLEMVISNFLSNALKYTNSYNQVLIRVMPHRFEIENIGSSIPEEELDKIWMTFHKVDKSRNNEGTGLGLSICRAILEGHGFEYGVYNSKHGVVFYFDF